MEAMISLASSLDLRSKFRYLLPTLLALVEMEPTLYWVKPHLILHEQFQDLLLAVGGYFGHQLHFSLLKNTFLVREAKVTSKSPFVLFLLFPPCISSALFYLIYMGPMAL